MTQPPIDLSQFMVSEPKQVKSLDQNGEIDLSRFMVNEGQPIEDDEGLLMSSLRNIARLGATGAASIAALPGDVGKAILALGEALPQGPEFLQKEPTFLQRGAKTVVEALPTQEQLLEPSKQIAESLGFEGFFDAKSPNETFADEVMSDFAVLATPIGGGMSIGRALGTSLSGNIAESIAESITDSKSVQVGAKLGTMFIAGLVGRPSAKQFSEELLGQVDKDVSGGIRVNSKGMEQGLEKLTKRLGKGLDIPEKGPVKKIIKQIENKISRGSVEAEELWNARKDINTRIANREVVPTTKRDLALVKGEIDQALKQLETINPGFSQRLDDAINSFAAVKSGGSAAEFISKQIKGVKDLDAKSLALLSLGDPSKLAKIGAAIGTVSGVQALQRIVTTPSLRPHYLNIMKAASSENAAAFTRAVKKFDNEVKKLDKKGEI